MQQKLNIILANRNPSTISKVDKNSRSKDSIGEISEKAEHALPLKRERTPVRNLSMSSIQEHKILH